MANITEDIKKYRSIVCEAIQPSKIPIPDKVMNQKAIKLPEHVDWPSLKEDQTYLWDGKFFFIHNGEIYSAETGRMIWL
jgi:hypothetical protein